jgi:hypothetical protein
MNPVKCIQDRFWTIVHCQRESHPQSYAMPCVSTRTHLAHAVQFAFNCIESKELVALSNYKVISINSSELNAALQSPIIHNSRQQQ